MEIERAVKMVRNLVPDLDGRISRFEVEAFEMDAELMEAFCEELERMSGDLQTGLATGDNEKSRVAAHSIKGMGGTMGLPEISVLAQEIELTFRDQHEQTERCAGLCAALISWSRDFIAVHK